MTTVYCVSNLDGMWYVPTLAEARADVARDPDADDWSIQRVKVTSKLPKRKLICALLNHESWAAGQEEMPL